MHTLLFCYANDRDRPLPDLRREDEGIDRLLDPRASRNHFQKIRESFATTEAVAGKLLTYADSLALFHFSGHAGGTILQLEDTQARGAGIAQLLGRCPNLRLVFLNGCPDATCRMLGATLRKLGAGMNSRAAEKKRLSASGQGGVRKKGLSSRPVP